MKTATYSLLTMRPDPERVDTLCIGLAMLTDGEWHMHTLPTPDKLRSVDVAFPLQRLEAIAINLKLMFAECTTLADARAFLRRHGSTVAVHDFEGRFAYDTPGMLRAQVEAIMRESVMPATVDRVDLSPARPIRPRIRARLRRQFVHMGILGESADDLANHKVVRNFPVSAKHGLVAEFALKNSAMHLTETVDFGVLDASMREKTFEAQAKCLVMHSAVESFGRDTQCHFVVSGSGSERVSRSVDLLSTVGHLYSLENSQDMEAYFEVIARAAKATGQLGSS